MTGTPTLPAPVQAALIEIKTALSRLYEDRLSGIYLYGSYARGDARPDSDIDVLVLLDQVADYGDELRKCLAALYPLSLQLDRHISPKPVDAREYDRLDCPLYQRVHQEGIAA